MEYRIDPDLGLMYGARGRPVGHKDRDGYLFHQPGGRYMGYLHRLIWEHVHGPIPDGMQINHINGIKDDNRICNLELVTPSQNMRHAYRTGLNSQVGERNRGAVLTAELVMAARRRFAHGERCAEIARDLGVNPGTLGQALRGYSWRHLRWTAAQGGAA